MIFYKDKFKKIRESRGLTLKEIATACDVTESTVQKWEKHPTLKPRPAKIPKLAALLRCAESDLARYGGPTERALDCLNERHEQIQNILFGADVGGEIDNIARAGDRRDRISPRDPNRDAAIAEENAEIRENLRIMFKKISRCLKVAEPPESAIDDFKFGLLRALIKSDMAPEDKDKALKIVENFGAER